MNMKKIFAILILITAGYTAGYSQSVFLEIDPPKPYTELYYFNEFSPGTIQFRDGTVFNGQLNILLASSTLCFLDKEGLPYFFSDISQVSALLIDRNYFIPLLGNYMQILDTDGNVMFGVEQYLELEAEKRYGAFGREEKSPNVPIEKRNLRSEGFNITTGGRSLAVETTPYTVHQQAYLIRDKKAYALNEKNFKKFFPSKKTLIEKYIKENSIDLSNASQALLLFKFLVAN